jgi:hypothetical protein
MRAVHSGQLRRVIYRLRSGTVARQSGWPAKTFKIENCKLTARPNDATTNKAQRLRLAQVTVHDGLDVLMT